MSVGCSADNHRSSTRFAAVMFPGTIRKGFNITPEFPVIDFVDFYASFQSLVVNLSDPFLTLFRRESLLSDVSDVSRVLLLTSVILILMLPSISWSVFSNKLKKKKGDHGSSTSVAGEWPESEAAQLKLWTWLSGADNINALFQEKNEETVPVSDAKYAEDLQVHEALLASLLTCQMSSNASSSAIQPIPTLNSNLVKIGEEVVEPPKSFCEICLEDIENWQMFRNEICSHTFCNDCTSRYITAKIQDSIKVVTCPGVDCNTMLDINACRFMIPKNILDRWDESLCQSLFLESQKIYCPFSDCSAMLINDSDGLIKEIECPACRRWFCAVCRVPLHSEFTCMEFQKLKAKKKRGGDLMVEKLAEKKKWKKCPRCKMYVEKTEGCIHITCRCSYQFCYRCGSKWSSTHGSCRSKP